MNLNIPNNNIDNSGFIDNGYFNAQTLPNFNSQLSSPPLGFQAEFETFGFKINVAITQYQQQELLNNTVMFSNPTEASTSFSYAQCIGNLAQLISPPHVSKSETFIFETSGFKVKITVVPIFNPMFQQNQ